MINNDIQYSILFVDDEEENLNVFQRTFKWYYDVHIALSAKEGLDILQKQHIDMVITDQVMPEVSGVEFLKQIIPMYPDLVRIILTGYADMEAIAYAINEAGIYQYIQKPWDADEMRHILAKGFNQYQLRLDNKKLIQDLQVANQSLIEINEQLEEKVKERTKEVENQKSALESQNLKITSSINYAKRIQEAMLPRIPAMQRAFGDLFVLFKPRDIVSGDFYWFYEDMHIKLIAAVDCTGHGVPGAFMSLVGHQALNRIVNGRNIRKPDLILNELHNNVRTLLKQDSTDNRDGMDLALCLYDKKNNVLEFAGAKNHLIFIQNNTLHQIKGDKHPIGGKQKEEQRLFTVHQIHIDQPTHFYIFTDGYQDQFGGELGRKFMIKNLKQLLLELHTQPLDNQHQILENKINDWMKNERQLDDILLIGFKLCG